MQTLSMYSMGQMLTRACTFKGTSSTPLKYNRGGRPRHELVSSCRRAPYRWSRAGATSSRWRPRPPPSRRGPSHGTTTPLIVCSSSAGRKRRFSGTTRRRLARSPTRGRRLFVESPRLVAEPACDINTDRHEHRAFAHGEVTMMIRTIALITALVGLGLVCQLSNPHLVAANES